MVSHNLWPRIVVATQALKPVLLNPVNLRGTGQLRCLPPRLQLENALCAPMASSSCPPSAMWIAPGIDRVGLLLQARPNAGNGASQPDGYVVGQCSATENPERFQRGSWTAREGARSRPDRSIQCRLGPARSRSQDAVVGRTIRRRFVECRVVRRNSPAACAPQSIGSVGRRGSRD